MKKLFILATLLAIGLLAYSQVTRTGKKTVLENAKANKESVRQSSGKSVGKTTGERKTSSGVSTQEERTKSKSSILQRTTSGSQNQAVRKNENSATRINQTNDPIQVRVNNSSASRKYQEEKGKLTRDDGTVVRHQNDEVFKKNDRKVDYDTYDLLRRSDDFRRDYNDYNSWYSYRVVRKMDRSHRYRYVPVEVRRERYTYNRPTHIELIWTPFLFNRFMYYYPTQNNWDIEFGREIETISAYDIMNYIGTVRRVYGKVEEVYNSRIDQNYILYIGERFPYQDMSVVIPYHIAYQITGNPDWYFIYQNIWVIGLIDIWDGKPEIIIRDEEQVRRY